MTRTPISINMGICSGAMAALFTARRVSQLFSIQSIIVVDESVQGGYTVEQALT